MRRESACPIPRETGLLSHLIHALYGNYRVNSGNLAASGSLLFELVNELLCVVVLIARYCPQGAKHVRSSVRVINDASAVVFVPSEFWTAS
jgi:hypothetical protein